MSIDDVLKSDSFIALCNIFDRDCQYWLIIERLLKLEWYFFDKVQGLSGKAICQYNPKMFVVMRLAQHLAFSFDTLKSLADDYEKSLRSNINPMELKYAYMMEYTDFEHFQKMLTDLPIISNIKRVLICKIVHRFENDILQVKTELPLTMTKLRPIENIKKSISMLSYFYCELAVYSYRTLLNIQKDIADGENMVLKILKNTVLINKNLL